MAKWKKVKGTSVSMPIGIGEGVILGLLFLLFVTFTAAWLMFRGNIETDVLGYLIMIGQVLGAFTGSCFAIKRVQRRKTIVGLLTGCILFLLLLGINGVFFGGQYTGTLTTALLLLTGGILAVLFANRGERKMRNRSYKQSSLCKIANR